MVFASLETAIALLIVGIALVLIARHINIEPKVNKILYILGILAIIVSIILFILFFVGIVI